MRIRNYEQIIKRANQSNISVYLQLKREINYHEANKYQKWVKKTCEGCANRIASPWEDCPGKYSCRVIGLNKDYYAFVESDHTCDVWSRK